MRATWVWIFAAGWLLGAVACGSDDSDEGCDPVAQDCDDGLFCDAFPDGKFECTAPVWIRGTVLDAADESPIAGARVQAADPSGVAVGTSATTDAEGRYELQVPALRASDGMPVQGDYTLRAQAAGYQAFPSGFRPALPLDAAEAGQDDNAEWEIENAITTIALLALPGDTSGLGSISGSIAAELNAGVLVVAEAGDVGYVGFSDSAGDYTVFNVPAGTYTVQGYAAGVQLESASAEVAAGQDATGADLESRDDPLTTVEGAIQVVETSAVPTSVVLAIASTFVPNSAKGSVPPGLVATGITGAFSIPDVPDGRYVVLAAFETEGLVRDPDQTIGGTDLVYIDVPPADGSGTLVMPESFKVNKALAVVSPGAGGPEAVTDIAPELVWSDDSSEAGYEVFVYDAFGTEMWHAELPEVSGSATVSTTYGGPALEPGMYYQFRAYSYRIKQEQRTYIAATEDLEGVFYYEPATQ